MLTITPATATDGERAVTITGPGITVEDLGAGSPGYVGHVIVTGPHGAAAAVGWAERPHVTDPVLVEPFGDYVVTAATRDELVHGDGEGCDLAIPTDAAHLARILTAAGIPAQATGE